MSPGAVQLSWMSPDVGAVSAVTPFLEIEYYARWFAWPNILLTAQVPLLVAIVALSFVVALRLSQRAPAVQ